MIQKNKKSLAETHPEIAQQWHPKLNGDLTPGDVTPGSNKKVWWKCDKGDDHEMSKLELENKKTEDNLSNGSRQVHPPLSYFRNNHLHY